MSEFKQGIFNILKKLGTSSLALALIYTLGHIIIAMSVVSVMTGASPVSYTHLTLPTTPYV